MSSGATPGWASTSSKEARASVPSASVPRATRLSRASAAGARACAPPASTTSTACTTSPRATRTACSPARARGESASASARRWSCSAPASRLCTTNCALSAEAADRRRGGSRPNIGTTGELSEAAESGARDVLRGWPAGG
eukprot:scaffold20818_cov112-Isochrysis_galbana.AAC.2